MTVELKRAKAANKKTKVLLHQHRYYICSVHDGKSNSVETESSHSFLSRVLKHLIYYMEHLFWWSRTPHNSPDHNITALTHHLLWSSDLAPSCQHSSAGLSTWDIGFPSIHNNGHVNTQKQLGPILQSTILVVVTSKHWMEYWGSSRHHSLSLIIRSLYMNHPDTLLAIYGSSLNPAGSLTT